MAFRIYRGIWQFQKADGSFENKYKLNQSGELVLTDTTGTVELGSATVTQADADNRYLLLAGGTVTGAAHFTHTSNTYAGASATITGRVQGGDVISTSGRFGSSADGGQDCYIYISDANNTYQEYTYGADFSFAGDTSYSNSVLIAGGLEAAKGVRAAKFYINDGNTKLEEGPGDALRITTTTGYIDIGSKNTGWIHFEGNRPYYFGNSLSVDGNVTPYSNNIRNLGGPSQRWSTIYGLNGDFSGDLVVGGTVTAQEFRTEYITQAVILQSGSTVFGNSYDDTHRYTGSLEILGSGSTILDVQGSQGQLFSVTDSLEGTLMSVNDISGLPILEVTSDDKVIMGTYNQNTLVVNGDKVGIGTDTPTYGDLDVRGPVYIGDSAQIVGTIFHRNNIQILNAAGNGFNTWATRVNGELDLSYIRNLTTSGNVGIGITAPTAKLHIAPGSIASDPGAKNYSGAAINTSGSDIATGRVHFQGYNQNATDVVGINNETDRLVLYNYTDGRYLQIWDHAGNTSLAPNAGNVGIGTTSPGQKLHVAGAIYSTAFVYGEAHLAFTEFRVRNNENYRLGTNGTDFRLNSVNDITFSTTTSYTERMRITSSGNVGIGITTPGAKLEVVGQVFLPSTHGLWMGGTAGSIGTWGSRQITSGGVHTLSAAAFEVNNSGYVSPVTSSLYVNTLTGNVGVGTVSPSYALDVQGLVQIGQDGTYGGGYGMIGFGGTTNGEPRIFGGLSNKTLYITSGTGGNIHFRTNGTSTNAVIIDTSGNVGIGNTSPSVKLDIGTSSSTTSIGYVRLRGYDNYEGNIYKTATYGIYMDTNTNLRPIRIDGSAFITGITGNVGIGTTSPSAKLDITGTGGDGTPILRISGSASNTFNWLSSGMHSNLTAGETNIHLFGKAQDVYNSAYVGYRHVSDGSSSNMLTLGLYASDYLVNILGSGNVGIGTTSPSYKLQVNADGNGLYVLGASISPYNQTIASFVYGGNGNSINIENQGGKASIQARVGASVMDLHLNPVGGNVGIGTTGPTTKLNVAGNIAIPSGNYLSFVDTNLTYNTIKRSTSVGGIQIDTGGSPSVNILDNGNVGIGTTSPPYKLTVAGDTYVTNANFHLNSGYGIVNAANISYKIGFPSLGNFAFENVNVGIGTTAPSSKLHIVTGTPTGAIAPSPDVPLLIDSSGDQFIEFRTTSAASGLMQGTIYSDNGKNAFIGYKEYTGAVANTYGESIHIAVRDFSASDAGSGIYLGATSNPTLGVTTPYMFIKGNGNVGIGTTNPIQKLQVAGSAYVNGGTLFLDTAQYIRWGNSNQGIVGENDSHVSIVSGGSTRQAIYADGRTYFPGLDLSISNANTDHGSGTYFRGSNSHFVLGLKNGNTLYLNYGNGGGYIESYGTLNHSGNINEGGTLTVNGQFIFNSSTASNYREGIRLNINSGWGGAVFGGATNSTSGITDAWWVARTPSKDFVIAFATSDTSGGLYLPSSGTALSYKNYRVWNAADFANNSTNWNTAYSWGNHANAGYTTIATPGTPGLSSKATNGDGIAMTITAASNAEYYEIWSSINSTTNYGLVGKIDPSSVASTMSFQDDTPATTGTIYYRVYGINKGKYGTPLEFSHAFSYTCPDPATVTIASTLNMFMITWEPVQSRLCSGYTITHHATSGTPSQGSATTIYTGKNTVALYPIPDGELDLNHQFWVTANTNT